MFVFVMVYCMEQQLEYLYWLEVEFLIVVYFFDWNFSYFLDVVEMAMAVGFVLDWCGKDMVFDILKIFKNVLFEKVIKFGIGIIWENWWWVFEYNWNLVCYGGLVIVVFVVFEEEFDLVFYILNRIVECFFFGLLFYQFDGVYNEGFGYWFYVINYLMFMIFVFELVVGIGFGFLEVLGVVCSVEFSEMMVGFFGDYYNYFDVSMRGYYIFQYIGLLSWFG